ncbi:MAG: PAS domain S-box protein [Nitrospira sp.]|nr:PAS domain S-box protein [Nitrospira sp.]
MPKIEIEEEIDQGSGMIAFVEPQSHKIIECNRHLIELVGIEKSRLLGRSVFDLFSGRSRNDARKVYQKFLSFQTVPEADLEIKIRHDERMPVTLRLSGSQDNQGYFHCIRFSWHNISQLKRVQKGLTKETRKLRGKLAITMREAKKQGISLRKEIQKRKTTQSKLGKSLVLLRRQARESRVLAGRLLRIQEDERRRLARDLHDETNQKLALLGIHLANLKQDLPLPTSTLHSRLHALHDHISMLADNIRQMAHKLHPAILEHVGVVEALQSYVSENSENRGVKMTFHHRNVPQLISLDLSLCLYRVTQECVGNALRHAKAGKIQISLQGLAKSLRLSIKDDGIGMNQKQFKRFSQGLGFVSMRERIRLVKGRLRVSSPLKGGTNITITAPFMERSS